MAAWGLLWDACNCLVAAFSLFQRGYSTETLALMRLVMERVACAMVLHDNPELVPRFRAGYLKDLGTRAIGPAGRVISDFAFTYGQLSALGTHVGVDNTGTGVIEISQVGAVKRVHLAIGGNLHTSGPELEAVRVFTTEICRIADRIVAQGVEEILFNSARRRAIL